MEKPNPKSIIDYKELNILCQAYLNDIGTDRMSEDEQSHKEHYIFEAAIEAIYGSEVWDYINSVVR